MAFPAESARRRARREWGWVPWRGEIWPAKSVGGFERARERFVRFVTRVQRHLNYLLCARPQFHRRPFQSQPPHMVREGLAGHGREDAMKMKTRKTGHARQLLQVQRLVQMFLDMGQDRKMRVL